MAAQIRLLAFAGSTRTDSYNKKLVRVAADGARAAGADVTVLDLRDLPMPLFDEDLEAQYGLHPNAIEFRKLLQASQGMLISSPEYNSSISAVLKNAIDWATRPLEGEPSLVCFAGKVAGLMSASPGAFGGLRGLVTLRSLLSNIRVLVLPDQIALGKAHEAFLEDGSLRDAKQREGIQKLGASVAAIAAKLHL